MCETLREHMGARRRGRRYLDQFSWYVLLGASGSGRSTALSNSGLEFPLETPATVASSLGSSVDSREYCGWRVTDEAVFIDAPGAFVTQPGPEEASEWQDLLDCLKSARPRRPLNGVILTLPADRLLDEALEPEALDRIRHSLQDMLAHFGTTLPVYVIVTKCDKIVGFVDFFSNLDAKERERPRRCSPAADGTQVPGVDAPLESPPPGACASRFALSPDTDGLCRTVSRFHRAAGGMDTDAPSHRTAIRQPASDLRLSTADAGAERAARDRAAARVRTQSVSPRSAATGRVFLQRSPGRSCP